MMPRCHFHLHDQSGTLTDEEGVMLDRLADAVDLAVANARGLITSDVTGGVLNLSMSIQVSDEDGRTVLILPFEEAVRRVV